MAAIAYRDQTLTRRINPVVGCTQCSWITSGMNALMDGTWASIDTMVYATANESPDVLCLQRFTDSLSATITSFVVCVLPPG
jgi:hypothetical protein